MIVHDFHAWFKLYYITLFVLYYIIIIHVFNFIHVFKCIYVNVMCLKIHNKPWAVKASIVLFSISYSATVQPVEYVENP